MSEREDSIQQIAVVNDSGRNSMHSLSPFFLMAAIVAALFYKGGLAQLPLFACLCFLSVWITCVLIAGHKGLFIPKTVPVMLFSALVVYLGATTFWTPVYFATILVFLMWAAMALSFLGYILTGDHERCWRWMSVFLLLCGLVLSLIGMYQHFFLHHQPRAVFLNPNSLAAFLNMIILVWSAEYLVRNESDQPFFPSQTGIVLSVVLLIFAVALTGSRGAALSLWGGLLLLCWASYYYLGEKKRILILAGITSGCFFLTKNLEVFRFRSVNTELLATAADPVTLNTDRILILERAWDMVMDAPWHGIGFGTFWLAWPPYKNPLDATKGYFVHNDYLQLWIEGGLPALILMLGLLAGIFFLFIRSLRVREMDGRRKVATTGLFAALCTMSFHSLFSYNFYILPSLILFGFLLGRFHYQAMIERNSRTITLQPCRYLGKRTYVLTLLLVLLVAVVKFLSMGASFHLYEKAMNQHKNGETALVHKTFERARRFWPAFDLLWSGHARIMHSALRQLPKEQTDLRRVLFNTSERLLQEAERWNPLRSDTYFIYGLLYANNPDLAGKQWKERAGNSFLQALRLDPGNTEARLAGAFQLMSGGELEKARQVLAEGLRYYAQEQGAKERYHNVLDMIEKIARGNAD